MAELEDRILKGNKIPGCEQLTRPEEISALRKYLGNIKDIQDSHTDLENLEYGIPGRASFPKVELGDYIGKLQEGKFPKIELEGRVIDPGVQKKDIALGKKVESIENSIPRIELETTKLYIEDTTPLELEDKVEKIDTPQKVSLEDKVKKIEGSDLREIGLLENKILGIDDSRNIELEDKVEDLKITETSELEDYVEDLKVTDDIELEDKTIDLQKNHEIGSLEDKILGIDDSRTNELEDYVETRPGDSWLGGLEDKVLNLNNTSGVTDLEDYKEGVSLNKGGDIEGLGDTILAQELNQGGDIEGLGDTILWRGENDGGDVEGLGDKIIRKELEGLSDAELEKELIRIYTDLSKEAFLSDWAKKLLSKITHYLHTLPLSPENYKEVKLLLYSGIPYKLAAGRDYSLEDKLVDVPSCQTPHDIHTHKSHEGGDLLSGTVQLPTREVNSLDWYDSYFNVNNDIIQNYEGKNIFKKLGNTVIGELGNYKAKSALMREALEIAKKTVNEIHGVQTNNSNTSRTSIRYHLPGNDVIDNDTRNDFEKFIDGDQEGVKDLVQKYVAKGIADGGLGVLHYSDQLGQMAKNYGKGVVGEFTSDPKKAVRNLAQNIKNGKFSAGASGAGIDGYTLIYNRPIKDTPTTTFELANNRIDSNKAKAAEKNKNLIDGIKINPKEGGIGSFTIDSRSNLFKERYLGGYGIQTTLKELCEVSVLPSSIEELMKDLQDGKYITTYKKFGTTGIDSRTMQYHTLTLDSNAYWEVVMEPFVHRELNGGYSYLPSIQEINTINFVDHGVNTGYTEWVPINSFSLNKSKLLTKQVSLFDGEITVPLAAEMNNELAMTIVDDEFKSWKHYFQKCMDVSVYNSVPHDEKYYKEGISDQGGEFESIYVPTAVDKATECTALYKNVAFRIKIYIMNPQYSTLKKYDLLCVLRDFSEEYIGEIDGGGGADITLNFSIVGECADHYEDPYRYYERMHEWWLPYHESEKTAKALAEKKKIVQDELERQKKNAADAAEELRKKEEAARRAALARKAAADAKRMASTAADDNQIGLQKNADGTMTFKYTVHYTQDEAEAAKAHILQMERAAGNTDEILSLETYEKYLGKDKYGLKEEGGWTYEWESEVNIDQKYWAYTSDENGKIIIDEMKTLYNYSQGVDAGGNKTGDASGAGLKFKCAEVMFYQQVVDEETKNSAEREKQAKIDNIRTGRDEAIKAVDSKISTLTNQVNKDKNDLTKVRNKESNGELAQEHAVESAINQLELARATKIPTATVTVGGTSKTAYRSLTAEELKPYQDRVEKENKKLETIQKNNKEAEQLLQEALKGHSSELKTAKTNSYTEKKQIAANCLEQLGTAATRADKDLVKEKYILPGIKIK